METAFQNQACKGLGRRQCCFFLAVFLSCAIQRSPAQYYTTPSIKLVPESPVVGGEAVLKVSSVGQMNMVNWYRAQGDAMFQNNVILTYAPTSPTVTHGPKYTTRETGLPDASLKISNLVASDTGNYTVQIITYTGPIQQTVFLKVAEGPLQRNISSTAVIVGAIVGSLVAIASLAITAGLLYKVYHNSQKRSHSKPILPSHRDTESPNFRASVTSDGYIDPREIHSPPHSYVAVLPALPKGKASPTPEEDHVYTELLDTDQNLYSSLK